MSGALPSVPVPTIDATGVHVPTYLDYYAYLSGTAYALYGSDINIDPDTQDGQLIGVQAQAMYDTANAVANAYNAMSPNTAQGVGLSSVVKINGIKRDEPAYSTVLQTVNGVFGTIITNGIVSNAAGGTQWALPATVDIPSGGTIVVTATCTTPGAQAAAANSLTYICTPTDGWYSTNNSGAASPGNNGEGDGALRQRQKLSTALPAQTLDVALQGALLQLPNVTAAVVYNNSTGSTDGDGVPAHSIWCVVQGGNNADIGTAIAIYKSLGCGTYGSQNYTYTPPGSQPPVTVHYDTPTPERIVVAITVKGLANYTSDIGTKIKNSLIAYVENDIVIGGVVEWSLMIVNATLPGDPDGATFRVQALTQMIYGGSLAAADIVLTAGQVATLQSSDITLTVT